MNTIEDLEKFWNWDTFFYAAEHINSAACFFSAAFQGRNDVIYVHHLLRGGGKLVLVDTDEARLTEMFEIYRGTYRCLDVEVALGDAWVVARGLKAEGKT